MRKENKSERVRAEQVSAAVDQLIRDPGARPDLSDPEDVTMLATARQLARLPSLLGPVDPSEVMAYGTPEMVEEKCLEALRNLAPGGGFILGPGCALPPITPDENIDAMIETAKKYQLE